jgi:CCR4-NOT transcriptional regulation complex NOT5 subunit
VTSGNSVLIAGNTNLSTAATEADTVTISLAQNLTDINSVSTGSSNGDLIIQANGTGSIVVDNILTFNSAASTPTASTITKLYNKTAAGGGTGLYFINSNISSGAEGELISKKKATALAIALG